MATKTRTAVHKISDEERERRRDEQRELVRASVEQLRQAAGWQAWLRARRAFHGYSLRNVLLILHQHPTASRVAGFRAWLSLGYAVRRGEHALRIWAPCPPSKKQLDAWRQAGANPDERPRTFYRLTAVFAQDQVAPLPPPAEPAPLQPPLEPVLGDSHAEQIAPLVDLATELGYTVSIEALDRGDGSCNHTTQQIRIAEGLESNGRLSVLIHELAHALLHSDPDTGSLTYAQEEIVVESIAFTACELIGLDTSQNSIPYLASWAEHADLDVLEQVAALTDRLARRIEDRLLGT